MNPYDMLDRFEKKYGEYNVLLTNYVEAREGSTKIRAKRLLDRHQQLIWMCTGYSMGVKQAKNV
jgi:hypothetical protein